MHSITLQLKGTLLTAYDICRHMNIMNKTTAYVLTADLHSHFLHSLILPSLQYR